VSKMISESTVRLAKTVHLSWIKISTIPKWTKTIFHLNIITKEYHPVCPKGFPSLWYIWRKLCTYHAPELTLSLKGPKKILHDPRDLGVPSGASKMIYQAMVCLVQTVYLSCTETNTISKWTETRFYMTHVT
jgi:hypothetical protein